MNLFGKIGKEMQNLNTTKTGNIPQPETLPRLDFIDALRGIAVCGVIMIHTWGVLRGFGSHVASFIDWGSRGVQLFFIVSAFTIFLSLKNRKENSFKGFFIRRFFRIAPLFYIVLAISAFFFVGFNNINWINFFAKILFIDNFYLSWATRGIIGVEWTIGVEMIFYVLAPLLFLRIKNLSTALILLCITFLTPILVFSANIFPSSTQWESYRAFSLISHFYVFIVGIVIFFLFNKFKELGLEAQTKISNVCLIFLVIFLCLDFWEIENYSKILQIIFSFHLQFLVYFTLLFFASIRSFLRIIWVNPVTIYLGKISYSLYLLHLLIYGTIIKTFTGMSLGHATIISFIMIIIVSSLTYYFIEKPFIKKGNYLAKKFATI
jgi:peptidoglycan/LPS O-acetylase OafA/YrhL